MLCIERRLPYGSVTWTRPPLVGKYGLGARKDGVGAACFAMLPRLRLAYLALAAVADAGPQPWEADAAKALEAQLRLRGGVFKFGATTDGAAARTAQGGAHGEAAGSGRGRRAKVKPFYIDATSVANDQFKRFVRETKYVTEAEQFQWSFVHEVVISKETLALADAKDGIGRVKESPYWVGVKGAFWRRPEGPDSSLKERGDHPVVHVSYNDARAYCTWANGRRLPTEKEWEFAARGGHDDEPYPWGEELPRATVMNSWQGDFPKVNTAEDGWVGSAPVAEYDAPNDYGLHNMLGNVWEWCEGGDAKVRPLRGGSYVDTVDGKYNHALRVWTRMENSPDSGSHNTGFRCASASGGDGAANLEEPPKEVKKKSAKDLDQSQLQDILAERGAEGLQEWLKEQGVGGSVMTPADLQKKQADIKRQKAYLESQMKGEL